MKEQQEKFKIQLIKENSIIPIQKLHQIISKMAQKHGVGKVWLFGSYARNEANGNSDIDLLIEKGKLETYIDIFRFQFEIENYFKKSVDIVTTEAIKNEYFLLKSVQKDGILIYDGKKHIKVRIWK